MSWKRLFSRALGTAPGRLHFAAHSHHLWPDASYDGQIAAWEDAARLADNKWDKVMGEVWPEAQDHVARELRLPDPSSVVFASNTHDFLIRIVAAANGRPVRILTTDGEFHSFRRQSARWAEDGTVALTAVPLEPFETFEDRFLARARQECFDLIFLSQVFFGSGAVLRDPSALAALSRPEGPWLVIDGYHGFMAVETDLAAIADRTFYVAGGYKYAMAGEGAAFLHAPSGYGERPPLTGWYAEFAELSAPPGGIGYATSAMRFMGATFDPSGLYRFNAVQRMLRGEGITTAVAADHVRKLQGEFVDRLPDTVFAKATILNPVGEGPHARFIALRANEAQDWCRALADRHIITDVRGDVLRIGFGLYQDREDLHRFLAEAARI